jgi:hypothetical protein
VARASAQTLDTLQQSRAGLRCGWLHGRVRFNASLLYQISASWQGLRLLLLC